MCSSDPLTARRLPAMATTVEIDARWKNRVAKTPDLGELERMGVKMLVNHGGEARCI